MIIIIYMHQLLLSECPGEAWLCGGKYLRHGHHLPPGRGRVSGPQHRQPHGGGQAQARGDEGRAGSGALQLPQGRPQVSRDQSGDIRADLRQAGAGAGRQG